MDFFNNRKTFKDFLLKVGKADILTPFYLEKVVSYAEEHNCKLVNKIINMPPDLELKVKRRIKIGIICKGCENKFSIKKRTDKVMQETDIPDKVVYS